MDIAIGGRSGRKKEYFSVSKIFFWEFRKLHNFQNLIFRTAKRLFFLPLLPPNNQFTLLNRYDKLYIRLSFSIENQVISGFYPVCLSSSY